MRFSELDGEEVVGRDGHKGGGWSDGVVGQVDLASGGAGLQNPTSRVLHGA